MSEHKSHIDNGADLLQLVSFKLGEEEYGVDVLKVREIIRVPAITRVPNTPQYVEGVINLRGKVIPIISMRDKFGLASATADARTRIIVMEMEEELMGFTVDAVVEVLRIAQTEIQPPPAISNSANPAHECLFGVVNRPETLLLLLDLQKMFLMERDGILGTV